MARLAGIGCGVVFGIVCSMMAPAADWNQWRGPDRNGIAPGQTAIAATWPKEGLKKVWESEEIPSGQTGGLGSVVVAEGRVYVYVDWEYREPVPTRKLPQRGLQRLGWHHEKLPPELAKASEAARLSDERAKLTGREIRTWAETWVNEHLEGDAKKKFGGYLHRRLRQGKDAVALDVLDKLGEIRDKQFESQAELDRWFGASGITGDLREKVMGFVETAVDRAHDVVVCLDAKSGETVWKTEHPGRPHGWGASPTPLVTGGRCYVMGSDGVAYCLKAETGKEVWQTKVASGCQNSSLVLADGVLVGLAGPLTGLDVATGKVLWQERSVSGTNNSPVVWSAGGKAYVICNSGRTIGCVDPKTGKCQWTAPGGGSSTVAVSGNLMVVFSGRREVGLTAYKLSVESAEPAWKYEFTDRASSPIIYEKHVYAIGGRGNGRVMCLSLEAGKLMWEKRVGNTEIASPILVDGKLIAVTGYGDGLLLLKATPTEYTELAKTRASMAPCTSPAFADGKLYLRLKSSVACYDLTGAGM